MPEESVSVMVLASYMPIQDRQRCQFHGCRVSKDGLLTPPFRDIVGPAFKKRNHTPLHRLARDSGRALKALHEFGKVRPELVEQGMLAVFQHHFAE
jgi:hypothetical protein